MVHGVRISHAVPLSIICIEWRRWFVKRHRLHMSLSQRGLPAAGVRPFGCQDVFLQRMWLALRDVVSILMDLCCWRRREGDGSARISL
jgi:hypothetical protein